MKGLADKVGFVTAGATGIGLACARAIAEAGGKVMICARREEVLERAAEKILCNHDICRLACASHNIRSISAVKEHAVALDVPEDRYEFQVLYGMAASVRRAILKATGRVRLYCPHGELLSGMAYLVRRLLENTSNESFVHQTFDKTIDRNRLLEDPEITLARFS